MGAMIQGEQFRWPGRTVPFEIADDILVDAAAAAAVQAAIVEWNDRTVMTLRVRDGENDYVWFTKGDGGCQSPVGRRGGRQNVTCALGGGGFTAASVIHEIGHAVGLVHEQQRLDAHASVSIDFDNVRDSAKHNFEPFQHPIIDLGPYDYDSIMHYPAVITDATMVLNASASTITCKPNACPVGMGSGTALSRGDRAAVAWAYATNLSSVGERYWTVNAEALAGSYDGRLFVIENGYLWEVDLQGGRPRRVTGQRWTERPVRMTVSLNGYVYIIENRRLHKINPNGNDDFETITGPEWQVEPIEISSCRGWIFIIESERLWKVHPDSGEFSKLTSPQSTVNGKDWRIPPIRMTGAVDPHAWLYIVENQTLYRVNPDDGSWERLRGENSPHHDPDGQNWDGDNPCLAYMGGALWLNNLGKVYRVDPGTGDFHGVTARMFVQPPTFVAGIMRRIQILNQSILVPQGVFVLDNGHVYRVSE